MSEEFDATFKRVLEESNEQASGNDCSCQEFSDNVYALLDSELGESMCDRLRGHVSTCPDCTEIVDAEQHVREILRRGCAEQAPESLRVRIVSQLTVARTSKGQSQA